MNNKKNYDYGKCHICGERMLENRINQEFWIKGNLLVIESVPAGVCPQCGEKIVKADVGRQLAKLIGNLRSVPKQRTISVPVIRYPKSASLESFGAHEELAMPKYTRNTGKEWTKDDVRQLKELARENTPTRVIGLKLGRTEGSVRTKAANEKVSLKPVNKSPYNRKEQ